MLVLLWLDDRINKAKWLTANEKAVLIRNIAAEEQHKEDPPIRAALAAARLGYGADLLLVRDGPVWGWFLDADADQGHRRAARWPSAC